MKLLDTLVIHSHSGEHRIELYHGDLAHLPAEHAVDVLVVSAHPESYIPVKGSLIRALEGVGVKVSELAKNKQVDLREQFHSWLSHSISEVQVNFKHVLCFEPPAKQNAMELVGGIFQSLLPIVYGAPYITSVALPLVSTGRRATQANTITMLIQLLEATTNWFELGLPVRVIKLVEFDSLKAHEMKGAFAVLKHAYADRAQPIVPASYTYDFFISYSHQNSKEVMVIHDQLLAQNPALKIFLDRNNLDTGAAWQQALYEALDDCKQIITILSPHYLLSKVCKEEFNIALARHREQGNVLVPFYLYTSQLPTYMQMIQFSDVREFDKVKIQQACAAIAQTS